MADRYGFLLRCLSRVEMPNLKFDGVFGVLSGSDIFNSDGFTFGEPPWRSTKLHINNRVAPSSGENVIRYFFSLLAAMVAPEAVDRCWCQA